MSKGLLTDFTKQTPKRGNMTYINRLLTYLTIASMCFAAGIMIRPQPKVVYVDRNVNACVLPSVKSAFLAKQKMILAAAIPLSALKVK